jgi:hypothetical protein
MTEITNEHILEKLDIEIIPSINLIKTQVAVIDIKLDKMKVLEEKTDKLFTVILGDGTDRNPGIFNDVKELKTWRDTRIWLERAISIAVIGELIGLFYLMVRLVFIHQ